MRAFTVLDQLQLGQGVAESDRGLERYFIQTPAFQEVVRDEAHLVLGVKGSGKTAISRFIGSNQTKIAELDNVVRITAFATQSSSLFAKLPSSTDDETMRQVWMAYFCSLVANYVAANGVNSELTARVSSLLEEADLALRPDIAPERIMRTLVENISPVSQRSSSRPLAGQAARRVPTGRARWLRVDYDFEPLIRLLEEALAEGGISCWILLDRLDEAFATSRTERPALRGLLRAHLDLISLTASIRTKIFLRSDIFDRVTQAEGFTNLDHLLPVKLTWRRDEIISLIGERIRTSATELVEREGPGASAQRLVGRLIPGTVTYFTGRRHVSSNAIDWCMEATAARQNEPSPRNMIRLLREAQGLAKVRLENTDAPFADGALLRDNELIDAWESLSQTRLFDTLYAESNSLRQFIETFRHQSKVASRDALSARFTSVDPECVPSSILRDLEGVGFLYPTTNGIEEVAPLYMPALEIGTGSTSRKDEFRVVKAGLNEASPERLRDAAKEMASQGELIPAINLLVKGYSIPIENAVLAANIAFESQSSDMLRKMDTFLGREEFARSLVGKRIAIKYALGKREGAHDLATAVTGSEDLDYAVGHFIGSLTFDPELEHRLWKELLAVEEWNSADASPWDRVVPVIAASRVLAVARNFSRPDTFEQTAEAIVREWYFAGGGLPADLLSEFLADYAEDFRTTTIGLFPYQVVSVLYALRAFGNVGELEHRVVNALVAHVSSGAEKHQRSFRDWAELDPTARLVVERMKDSRL